MHDRFQTINDPTESTEQKIPLLYPLSAAQKALWYMHQQAALGAAYHGAFAARIHAVIDVAILQQAFQSLFERHSSLRSTITLVRGEPFLLVHDNRMVDFVQIHCRGGESEDELRQRVQYTYAQPFDLEEGPLFRVRLFTRNATDHVLLLCVHHLIMDGVSMGLLLEELRLLYATLFRSIEPQLPVLRATYQDFVIWEQETLARQGEKLWRYWHEQLAGSESLQLPIDRPRPSVQSYHGASYHFQISGDLHKKLDMLAGTANATLYSLLLAAFQVLLYRYTGQEQFVVGTPAANRLEAKFHQLVGYLANLLPLRANLSRDLSFYHLLQQVQARVFAATLRQNLPFSTMIARLNPQRDRSYAPLAQVMFGLLSAPKALKGFYLAGFSGQDEPIVPWGELQLSPFALPQQEGQADLLLEMEQGRASLLGVFKYNTDLFNGSTIERMAGHFQALLESIVADPTQPVSRLPLLTPAERHQLLVEWNDTTTDYPTDKPVHQLFEEQATRTPDAVAVVFAGDQGTRGPEDTLGDRKLEFPSIQNPNAKIQNSLTYQELNVRANQLAHYLQSLGVGGSLGAEVMVGICVERSLDMIVGLLAILKAGGVHVPLDPAYPPERLAFIVADAQIQVLLTQEKLLPRLPTGIDHMICLDREWAANRDPALTANLPDPVDSHQAAYVIYTSGSTGQPKGVVVEHQALAAHIQAAQAAYQITADDRLLQFASFTFDVSLEQIFLALCSGATLVMRGTELWSSKEFDQQAFTQRITVADLPPAYFHQLLLHWQSDFPAWLAGQLRLILVGGERIAPETIQLWQQLPITTTRLINAYGPTEATITATCFDLSTFPVAAVSNVPIGRPLANRQLYVLDSQRQPTPIGVCGELYIGGAQLARGYWNRPALTRQSFIDHPEFGRLYKTGDLCRWRSDGNLEFLGRTDFQVQIRGFRIELGEIENALLAQDGVREAVVLAREDNPDDKRLVAYFVGDTDTDRLRQQVAQRLPAYMVPTAFVRLETLPLTPTGKLDRRTLPAPTTQPMRPTENILPQTETERAIAAIWRETLQVDKVGIHENFFDLGGHSLLAMQVYYKLQTLFGEEITLMDLFRYPTVQTLAEHIKRPQKHPPTAMRQTQRETRSARWAGIQQRRTLRQQIDPTKRAR